MQDPGQDTKNKEIFSDEKTSLKIHKHLSDMNDVISEQDIKDVRTDIDQENAGGSIQKEATKVSGNEINDRSNNKETEEKNEMEGEKESIPIVTPWSILGS